jgi:threonine dehydrogenase-like Zn-dependent dehydrogenase
VGAVRRRPRGHPGSDPGRSAFRPGRHHSRRGLHPYAAIVETGAVRPAQSVGIWGAGGLGAHGIRLARLVGAAPIIAIDPLPSARERALAFGADFALDPRADDFAEAVQEATGGRGIEVAFDFAGVGAARVQATAALGPDGVLVLAGLTPEPLVVEDSTGFCFRGNQVRGHYGSGPEHVEQLIGLTAAGRIDLAPSITEHIPLAEAGDAVARLEKKIGDPIRFVLTP